MTDRETHRWYGVASIAFLAAGVGVVTSRPSLLLVSVVGIAFAAYARSGSPPSLDLDVDRELSTEDPDPGEEVTVTVRVTNEGDLLPDLRLVDGVPPAITVVEGSPRLGTALRPGKAAEFSYVVEAERGEHAFDPVTVIARDASGAVERERTVEVPSAFRCVPRLVEGAMRVPLRRQTARFTGPVATDVGGTGIEFYATRDYRPGDSMTQVDWSRLARTGELATLEFREERMATVVLVIDARDLAYEGEDEHALERSVDAAGTIATALLADGHRVGLSALGRESCWLPPGAGEGHRTAIREALAMHPALAPTPPTGTVVVAQRVRELRQRLPADAQVFLFTPLADSYAVTLAGRLEAHGHATTVVSPDVTGAGTPGQRLSRIERWLRINRLRSGHVPVIDWVADESIEHAVAVSREVRR